MTPSKAARILRRTLTGGTLVLVVAGLLAWTKASGDGRPLLYAASVVLVAAVYEASRMGALALRDTLPALLVSAVAVLLVLRRTIDGGGVAPHFLWAYAACAVLAAVAHATGRAIRHFSGSTSAARIGVYATVGAIAVLTIDGRIAQTHALVALLALFLASIPFVLRQANGLRELAITVGLAVWLVPPLPALWEIWHTWSTSGLVAFLVCAKIGDTAGYYVGTAIGRHHPFPGISPGKTLEGCIGSFAAGTAAGGIAVATHLLPGSIAAGCAAGALVNLAAQAGDLCESWVKRRAGVKDSSTIFGPSGGILDQLDSLLVAVPVALGAWPWILGTSAGSH
jgi:CDP-diglyceride synthetase